MRAPHPGTVLIWMASLLLLTNLPRVMRVNLGYVELMKSRLDADLPIQPSAVYDLTIGGDANRLGRAERLFVGALQLAPNDAFALSGLAQLFAHRGELSASIAAWHAALDASFPSDLGRMMLGNVYAAAGDRQAALGSWKQAIRPSSADWIRLALMLARQQRGSHDSERWGDAISILEEAIRDLPMRPSEMVATHTVASDIAGWLGNHTRGLYHADEAARIGAQDASAHAWLAWYLATYGLDSARAVAEAQIALEFGSDWRSFLVIGNHHLANCRLLAAQEAFGLGLALPTGGDWRHVYLWLGLAEAQWETGNGSAAIESFTQVIRLQPGMLRAQNLLAQAEVGTLPRHCAAGDLQ